MLYYILKRVAYAIPVLFFITLIGFFIQTVAPIDPVERFMQSSYSEGNSFGTINKALLMHWRKKLGIDKPLFYFSISPWSVPDSIYKIMDRRERKNFEALCYQYGNANAVNNYVYSVQLLELSNAKYLSISACRNIASEAEKLIYILRTNHDHSIVESSILQLKKLYSGKKELSGLLSLSHYLENNLQRMKELKSVYLNYLPKINFYTDNRYHFWLFGDGYWLSGENAKYSKGIIRGDFGLSYSTQMPIGPMLLPKILLSSIIAFFSILIAYIISIPLGIYLSSNANTLQGSLLRTVILAIGTLPIFFIGTLFLMLFANPDVFNWFPTSGISSVSFSTAENSLSKAFSSSVPYFILPVLTYVFASFSFLSIIMNVSLDENLTKDYITTARAKGLSNKQVLYRHALKNSLFPMITAFGSIFPLMIGGSVIIESIFSIPGMGTQILTASYSQDYSVIVAILTLASLFTSLGFLITDILYCIVDPRVKEQMIVR